MLALGLRAGREVVPIREIAVEQRIPKRFLEQILNDLKNSGVVFSRRGVQGGYQLGRDPERISLAEIIRHIDGPLAPVSCVSERYYAPCSCPDEARCGIRLVMQEVRDAVATMLEGVSLADLCARTRAMQAPRDAGNADYMI